MYIRPTKSAKIGNLGEMLESLGLEDIYYDIIIYPKGESISMPWDADLSVEDGNIVLDGAMTPGSAAIPRAAGSCVCTCSIDRFNQWFEVEVPPMDQGMIDEVEKATGWEVYE